MISNTHNSPVIPFNSVFPFASSFSIWRVLQTTSIKLFVERRTLGRASFIFMLPDAEWAMWERKKRKNEARQQYFTTRPKFKTFERNLLNQNHWEEMKLFIYNFFFSPLIIDLRAECKKKKKFLKVFRSTSWLYPVSNNNNNSNHNQRCQRTFSARAVRCSTKLVQFSDYLLGIRARYYRI